MCNSNYIKKMLPLNKNQVQQEYDFFSSLQIKLTTFNKKRLNL
jgi:hypothetical protein